MEIWHGDLIWDLLTIAVPQSIIFPTDSHLFVSLQESRNTIHHTQLSLQTSFTYNSYTTLRHALP